MLLFNNILREKSPRLSIYPFPWLISSYKQEALDLESEDGPGACCRLLGHTAAPCPQPPREQQPPDCEPSSCSLLGAADCSSLAFVLFPLLQDLTGESPLSFFQSLLVSWVLFMSIRTALRVPHLKEPCVCSPVPPVPDVLFSLS